MKNIKNIPKISIITPTYNHEKYIRDCIESVINQTFGDFEMIIIDDCSNDNTHEIAKNYALKDKRIKIIRHQKRWGLNNLQKTYNQGVSISKANLIAILEGDDYWPLYKLEKQIPLFKNKKISLSFGDCVIVNQNSTKIKIIDNQSRINHYYISNPELKIAKLQEIISYLIPATIIFRKDCLRKAGGFISDPYYPFVDIPTWYNLLLHGEFIYKNEILGFYRKHIKSAWFSFAKNTDAMATKETQNSFNNFIKKNQLKLERKGVIVDIVKIKNYQYKILKNKIKKRTLSIFMHKYIFYESKFSIKTLFIAVGYIMQLMLYKAKHFIDNKGKQYTFKIF